MENLVTFLYILGRDHLPLGTIQRIIKEHIHHGELCDTNYTNKELEAYARRIAQDLVED